MSHRHRAGANVLLAVFVTLAANTMAPAFAETQATQTIGTHKRGGGAAAAYGQRGGEFTGTFMQVWDPFTKSNVSSYSVGTYTDHGTGQQYEGEFSYIPARANGYESGYYLFQGARIDSEADEVIQGLFVSDATIANSGIRFRRARPDYLVKLQEDFQTSQVQATADAQQQSRSRENMSSLLNVMGGLLSIAGGGNLSSLRSSSLSALTSGLTGKGSSGDILKGVVSQIVSRAGADPSLGKALGGSTDTSSVILSLTGLNKSSQPMSRAQYALQMASMLTNKGTSGIDSANGASTTSNKVMDTLAQAAVSHTSNVIAASVTDRNDAVVSNAATAFLQKTMASSRNSDPTAVGAAGNGQQAKQTEGPPPVAIASTLNQPAQVMSTPSSASQPTQAVIRTASIPAQEVVSTSTSNSIANFTMFSPPDDKEFKFSGMYATNDGVYISAGSPAGDGFVVKRTNGHGSAAGWLTAKLPKSAEFSVSSLAPEQPDEFAIRWATPERFGSINMNNNGSSVDYKNDGAIAFVPSGAKSKWVRYWATGNHLGTFLKNSGGGQATDFEKNFTNLTKDNPIRFYNGAAAVDEEGTTLFLVAEGGAELIAIDSSKKVSRYDLSTFENGHVTNLIAAHGKLWIGYGKQILVLSGGKISPVAKVNTLVASITTITRDHMPTFCIAGSDLYLSDGNVISSIDGVPSRPRSFLQSDATLSPRDSQAVLQMNQALSVGIYCATTSANTPVIYALGLDLLGGTAGYKLFAIQPRMWTVAEARKSN